MASVFPGGLNTFVPQAIASLQTNFSRNPSKFSVNQYTTIAQVPEPTGYYIYHNPAEEDRINYANMADMLWADGAMPQLNFAKSHEFPQFTAKRYHQMFAIGDVAAQNAAGWDVITDHANTATSRLMTVRSYNVLTALTTTGNWGNNTNTATLLGGGYWSAGDNTTAGQNYIKRSINAAIQAIQKATNGMVGPEDLVLVVAPPVAAAMGQSLEIIDYLKQSYVAKDYISQTPKSAYYWGVPDPLYGVRTVVEDAVYNSAAHGATPSMNYILGKNAILLARPGALEGPLNTMSTVTLAMYQDMNMVLEHSNIGQLTQGVLWDYYATIVRPESGFLITQVIA